jgi:hypothetical protein
MHLIIRACLIPLQGLWRGGINGSLNLQEQQNTRDIEMGKGENHPLSINI